MGKFLVALAASGAVALSAAKAGISRPTIREKLKSDPGFAEAYGEALELYAERLEVEAHRRAIDGVERRKFWQGVEVEVAKRDRHGRIVLKDGKPVMVPYLERHFSDRLLERLLERRLPQVYLVDRVQPKGAGDASPETEAWGNKLIACIDRFLNQRARLPQLAGAGVTLVDDPDEARPIDVGPAEAPGIDHVEARPIADGADDLFPSD